MATFSTSNLGTNGQRSDDVGNAITQGADASRDAGERLKGTVSDTAERLSSSAHEALDKAKDTASEYASRVADTRDQLLEDARDYIAEYPLRTLGIAALTGYVLGRMMR